MVMAPTQADTLIAWAISGEDSNTQSHEQEEVSRLLDSARRIIPCTVQWLGWKWGNEVRK